jgi:SSS family solute:Na+ symporter
MHWIDVGIILISLTVTVTVGLWFSRNWQNSDDYFLAGRNLSWPLIGFSLFATNISTEHFVGLAEGGYAKGLVVGGYEWMASYCLIMLAVVFAPQYLKHQVVTIPEFFEKRFGIETRVGLSAYFLVMIVLTKTTLAIYTGSLVISSLIGANLAAVMWGVGIFTAVYTLVGGLRAVVYTDFVQAIVLIGGSTVLTVRALTEVGGWGNLVETLQMNDSSQLLSMVRPSTDPDLPFTGFLLGNFLIGGMFYWCMDQVNVQRVLGARDIHHARAGALFASALKIIPVFIMVLPGVIATVLYPDQITHPQNTYYVLVENLLPVGLKGLVLAALIAALMSSLSSSFNSAATLISQDFVARFRPQTSMKWQIRSGQVGLVVVMVLGVLCTPLINRFDTIWDYLQIVTGYLSVPFAVAGLLGVFSRRINRQGALAGILSGAVAGGLLFAESQFQWDILTSPYLASFLHRIFLAGIVSAGVMTVVSLATPAPPEEVTQGAFSFFGDREIMQPTTSTWYADYRLWAILLFTVVTVLWWVFA